GPEIAENGLASHAITRGDLAGHLLHAATAFDELPHLGADLVHRVVHAVAEIDDHGFAVDDFAGDEVGVDAQDLGGRDHARSRTVPRTNGDGEGFFVTLRRSLWMAVLSAAVFAGMAGRNLEGPGLYYDEAHPVPAAFAWLGVLGRHVALVRHRPRRRGMDLVLRRDRHALGTNGSAGLRSVAADRHH